MLAQKYRQTENFLEKKGRGGLSEHVSRRKSGGAESPRCREIAIVLTDQDSAIHRTCLFPTPSAKGSCTPRLRPAGWETASYYYLSWLVTCSFSSVLPSRRTVQRFR